MVTPSFNIERFRNMRESMVIGKTTDLIFNRLPSLVADKIP